MFHGNSVSDVRLQFFNSWSKYQQKQPLLPLDQQIVQVLLDHPEYQAVLSHLPLHPEKTYFPELGETNPFLHMGLHLAVREHIATDRPSGIRAIYHQLITRTACAQTAEHLLMDCLAECLWQAERSHSMPNEANYLNACQEHLAQVPPST